MVRKGEVFNEDVEFHCADFDWEELRAEYAALLEQQSSSSLTGLAEEEQEQSMKWELEYQRHAAKFHPIKNYIIHAFPELETPYQCTICEAGCGTGSCILPLIRQYPGNWYFAFDFSPTALEHLRQHPIIQPLKESVTVFEWDVASQELPPEDANLEESSLDFCLLTFVLSACTFPCMPQILKRIRLLLKPTGRILFRDYGVLDHAHLRFMSKQTPQLGPNCYMRGNGTVASFFELATTQEMFEASGYRCDRLAYHCVENRNRKTGVSMKKVFLNGVFSRHDAEH